MANLQAQNEDTGEPVASDEEATDTVRAFRLREAVRSSGGNKAVATRAGMPVSTLNRYIAGRDMKASAMVALARATGVRLEWLATGKGPMHEGGAAEDLPPATLRATERQGMAEPALPDPSLREGLGIAWQVDPDRLARAYAMASERIGGSSVTPALIMRIALVIYDHLTETEAAAKAPPEG